MQHIAMRINRRHIPVHNYRIKVKIIQTPDSSQLIIMQVSRRSPYRRSRRSGRRRHVGIKSNPLGGRTGRRGSNPTRRVRPRRNAEVERIHQPMVSSVIDAHLPRLPHHRRRRKGKNQVRVRIHADGLISRKIRDGSRLRPPALRQREPQKQHGTEPRDQKAGTHKNVSHGDPPALVLPHARSNTESPPSTSHPCT